jgi:hypothetical protein
VCCAERICREHAALAATGTRTSLRSEELTNWSGLRSARRPTATTTTLSTAPLATSTSRFTTSRRSKAARFARTAFAIRTLPMIVEELLSLDADDVEFPSER